MRTVADRLDALLNLSLSLSLSLSPNSRPTAVNLAEATNRMAAAARAAAARPQSTAGSVKEAVVAAAEAYLAADVAANIALGDYGADAVLSSVAAAASSSSPSPGPPSVAVLTHCNAGALATAGHGTALGVIRSLAARGRLARAFCTETRPYNQGARLTAFELASEGLPATLLCDSAAAALLVHGGACSGASQERGEGERGGRDDGFPLFVGRPHAVVVGADRVAANGDTANKVGTLALAVAAKRGGVPFFVAAPTTTLDALLPSGEGIPIEQRPTREVTHSRGGSGERVAAEGVRVWNPSFDVTPADLITGGIITEKGMVPRRAGTDSSFAVAAFVAEHATGPAAEAAQRRIREEAGGEGGDPAAPPPSGSPSDFERLDCASVAEFVAARPALAALVGDPARVSEWEVREVGDGNINFVFVVRGEDAARAIVVKQALPFIRIAPDWPLSVDRARIEAAALREHGRLLALEEGEGSSPPRTRRSPLIPRVHLFDPERAVIAMDFVSPPAAVARGHLVAGKVVPGLAEDVAEYAAVTLFGTSLLSCPESETAAWRASAADFANPALCALTERVVFTDPYYASATNRHTSPQLDAAAAFLRNDAEGAAWALRLKMRFSGTREALLHGDLHTGSVMGVGVEVEVGGEGVGSENGGGGASSSTSSLDRPRAVVIDPEFAFYGPIGFDLGEFTANLLMALLATDGKVEEEGKEQTGEGRQRAWLGASVTAFWDRFELRFRALWRKHALGGRKKGGSAAEEEEKKSLARLEMEQDVFLASVRDDAVRFAGCCVLRRIVGIAHVEDFESILDSDVRSLCEARALRLGREMMVGGSAAFGSFGALVEAAERERGRSREEGWVGRN